MIDTRKMGERCSVVIILGISLLIFSLVQYTGVYCSYRIRYETSFIAVHRSPGSARIDPDHLQEVLRKILLPNVCSSEQFEANFSKDGL